MRTLTVTGHGSSTSVPDSAVVRVSVGRRGESVADAFDATAVAAGRLTEVASRHTAPGRIASTGVTVWPRQDRAGVPEGFEARHGYAVSCPDVATAGALLGELVHEVGDAVQVEGLALQVSDPVPVLARAREAAWADASRKAEQLAALAGLGLGEVQAVVEGAAGPGVEPVALRAASISPGESDLAASVTVTWELLGT